MGSESAARNLTPDTSLQASQDATVITLPTRREKTVSYVDYESDPERLGLLVSRDPDVLPIVVHRHERNFQHFLKRKVGELGMRFVVRYQHSEEVVSTIALLEPPAGPLSPFDAPGPVKRVSYVDTNGRSTDDLELLGYEEEIYQNGTEHRKHTAILSRPSVGGDASQIFRTAVPDMQHFTLSVPTPDFPHTWQGDQA